MSVRVHRIPFSTNVERVAIACGVKAVEVEWVDHDAADRSPIRALSGQDLVPVLETGDGQVLVDSPVILRWLEEAFPDPPLWPADPVLRARVDVLVEWFNGVWKGPPNALADGTSSDPAADEARLRGWVDVFEGLSSAGEWLVGDAPTAADLTIAPFLAIAAGPLEPGDDDPFHRVLVDASSPGPRARAWLRRVAALPRA